MSQAIPGVFRPEHFDDIPINDTWDTSIVADRANQVLAEIAKDWPVVYGYKCTTDNTWGMAEQPGGLDTHTARLAFVTELKPKEPCEHVPRLPIMAGEGYFCVRCNAALAARWELAE